MAPAPRTSYEKMIRNIRGRGAGSLRKGGVGFRSIFGLGVDPFAQLVEMQQGVADGFKRHPGIPALKHVMSSKVRLSGSLLVDQLKN